MHNLIQKHASFLPKENRQKNKCAKWGVPQDHKNLIHIEDCNIIKEEDI